MLRFSLRFSFLVSSFIPTYFLFQLWNSGFITVFFMKLFYRGLLLWAVRDEEKCMSPNGRGGGGKYALSLFLRHFEGLREKINA